MAAAVSDRIATLSAGRGLVFGCDYNPEQWDRSVWPDDVRLMRCLLYTSDAADE